MLAMLFAMSLMACWTGGAHRHRHAHLDPTGGAERGFRRPGCWARLTNRPANLTRKSNLEPQCSKTRQIPRGVQLLSSKHWHSIAAIFVLLALRCQSPTSAASVRSDAYRVASFRGGTLCIPNSPPGSARFEQSFSEIRNLNAASSGKTY